jgi:hypothetical protein
VAVIEHGDVVGIALGGDILREGGQQVVKGADRQLVFADDRGEGAEPGNARRFIAFDALQFTAEAGQLRQAFGIGCVAFVGKVVSLAREAVNQGNRAPQAARQQD